MASKADILAQLRQSVAAIERGDTAGAAVQSRDAVRTARSEVERAMGPILGSHADAALGPCSCSGRAQGEQAARESEKTAEAAYQKILRWVAVRERSTAYLRNRLAQDDFPVEAIDEALERALRTHAVDDRRYCDALVRMRLAAGKGLRGAEVEIAELGIDPCSLDAWQEHEARGADAEVERALGVLRRRPPRAKQAREAAFRKLVGQGYATDVAASAARRWYEESLCRE